MELFSSSFIETFAATLQALSNGQDLPAPKDLPVERGYGKFIFNSESKENEETLEVVIKAKMQVIVDDCNRYTGHSTSLVKALGGYYLIDAPISASTKIHCETYHVRLIDITLRDNVLPYNSKSPIVIHALQGISVNYAVRPKTPTDTASA